MPVKRIVLTACVPSASTSARIVSPSAMNLTLASQNVHTGRLAPATQGARWTAWAAGASTSSAATAHIRPLSIAPG